MKERHVTSLLFPYVDGELSDAERRPVDEHLARCSICQAELEYTRRVRGVLARRPDEKLNPFFWARLTARLEREERPRTVTGLEWAFPRLVPLLGAVAAILAIVFVLGQYLVGESVMGEYLEMWMPRDEMAVLADASALSRDDVLSLLISATDTD